MHLLLQIWTDPYDISHESFLGGPAFGLCSAWRYGAFWRFGDQQQNGLVYSDAANKFKNTFVVGMCVRCFAVASPSQ